MADYPKPPFESQSQPIPGSTDAMRPRPDHGEDSYKAPTGSRTKGAIITGGDTGIGRAVAIAYAREGADVLISYLESRGRRARPNVGGGGRPQGRVGTRRHPGCRALPQIVAARRWLNFGRIDMLVNNAAHQASFKELAEISDEEWELTFKVNIHAMFYLTKAAMPHMQPGSAIINTASINSDMPNPILLAYATTKGAIQNFTAGLAQLLAEKGHPRQCGRARADLDTAHPLHAAGGVGCELRQTSADATARPAGRTGHGIRDAGRSDTPATSQARPLPSPAASRSSRAEEECHDASSGSGHAAKPRPE